jgi:hypothetical protein
VTDLRDSDAWHLGRRGEILADIVLSRHGFTLLDAANTSDRATKLHRYDADVVAPDLLGVMTRPLWFEIKTKGMDWVWTPDGRDDTGKRVLPAGPAQGIDQLALERYRKAQRNTGMPVVLLLIIIPTGEMIAQTLDALGEPYPSVQPQYPLVNWPKSQFMRIYTLNQDKLDQYFYDPPLHGSTVKRVRRAPLHMPEQRLRELLYNRLQPEQGEMQGFRQQLFECANGRWTA